MIMKDYFKQGHTKNDFINKYFDAQFNKKRIDGKDLKKPTIFEKYILIDPDKSKGYVFWQFVLLLACLMEFLMVPFIIGCTEISNTSDKTQWIFSYNLAVDGIWVCNIFVCFITSYRDQLELIKDPKTLAIAYIK